MDIEHLSKSQIILLTLLISFVTSIATGIVTVSLMDQAPPVVAQSVSRVIERTIERVASSTPQKTQAAASVVTQEKTVVVNESNLIAQAITNIEPSIVHLYTANEQNPVFLSVGIVIDQAGTILTDRTSLDTVSNPIVVMADGTRLKAHTLRIDADNGFAFLSVATSTDSKPLTWVPVRVATGQSVLGQTVVAISGKTTTRISPGVITALIPAGGGQIIDTNIPTASLLPGSPIVSSDGAVVGVSTSASRASSEQGFVPASVLLPSPVSSGTTKK